MGAPGIIEQLLEGSNTMMRRMFIATCVVLMATSIVFAADGTTVGPWNKMNEKAGIVAYARANSRSPVNEVKAVGIIKEPVPVVESLFRDFSAWKQFMFMAKVTDSVDTPNLKSSSDTRYIYIKQGFPWPMSDRDGIAKVDFSINRNTGEVRVICRSVSTDYRIDPKVIRMPLVEMVWILKPVAEGTELTYQNLAAPGGNLPAAPINFISKRIGVNTLLNIRNMVKQEKYQSRTIITQTLWQPRND